MTSEPNDVIPLADSRELVRASGLPGSALLVVVTDHLPADPEPFQAMPGVCERVAGQHDSVSGVFAD